MSNPEEEEEGPWCSDFMICERCSHEWAAVHNCAEELECPVCGHFTKSAWADERDEWLEYIDEDGED